MSLLTSCLNTLKLLSQDPDKMCTICPSQARAISLFCHVRAKLLEVVSESLLLVKLPMHMSSACLRVSLLYEPK